MKFIYLIVMVISVLGQGCATTQRSDDNLDSKMHKTTKTLNAHEQYEKKQVFRRGNYIKSKYGYYITDLSINFDKELSMIGCNKSLLVTDLSMPHIDNKKIMVKSVSMTCKGQ